MQDEESAARLAEQIDAFLSSDDGRAGLLLLRESNRYIRLAEESEAGMGFVYFLDGEGLKKSLEPMGTWIAYASDVPRPVISRLTALDLVHAMRGRGFGGHYVAPCEPEGVVAHVRSCLKQIVQKESSSWIGSY